MLGVVVRLALLLEFTRRLSTGHGSSLYLAGGFTAGLRDTPYEMRDKKLKTAVLGLDERGLLLLEAASQTGHFHIEAVADKDTKLAERIAAEYKCTPYDDYRQLITTMDSRLRGNDIGCLLVAAGMYSCDEYIRAAMKKKFNVLKLTPTARNFEEAAAFVQLAEDENIKFAVANPLRFARSFLALRKFLEEGRIEQIFLITAVCAVGNQQCPSWQSDPKLAGGGVLLHNCYEIIDQMVWNFAVPQQVYSLNANTIGNKGQRPYLTEDTAVVMMKFADAFFGNLTAGKAIGPRQKFLKVHGKDKILTVSDTQFVVSNEDGQISEQLEYDDNDLGRIRELLENFALSILSPDENKLCCGGKENLKTMAVVESAYLSARTSVPEEPGRILQMVSRQVGVL